MKVPIIIQVIEIRVIALFLIVELVSAARLNQPIASKQVLLDNAADLSSVAKVNVELQIL